MKKKKVIFVHSSNDSIVVKDSFNTLSGVFASQLHFWGFKRESNNVEQSYTAHGDIRLLTKVVTYFSDNGLFLELSPATKESLKEFQNAKNIVEEAKKAGKDFKDGNFKESVYKRFRDNLSMVVHRPLKEHQIKAAFHLFSVCNGANFSVSGSGKSAVVLSVFEFLRRQGILNLLFVVGPPSCFAPWQFEYELTLGKAARWEILAGGDRIRRQARYAKIPSQLPDMFLASYQSVLSDRAEIVKFLNQIGLDAFLVIDEAHYIKQLDGSWATAILGLSSYAKRRCILTGTPIPRSYTDAFNLFDFLWPDYSPLGPEKKLEISIAQQTGEHDKARSELEQAVGSLFYRVRKSELKLLPPVYHPPKLVTMNKYERIIYDAIQNRIRSFSNSDYLKSVDVIRQLQRARMIRLRQSASYASLLETALLSHEESVVDEPTISDLIATYDTIEMPAKVRVLKEILVNLIHDNEKAVVWVTFIGTLKMLFEQLVRESIKVKVIFGETPIERTSMEETETRERIIEEFKDPSSGLQVLLINPAACSESISLHTACRHAIYYDMSYNCAQYLQSLDRIHRVGGSELKQAQYHFLQYENTVDQDIYDNLQAKADRMYAIIERDYTVYSLDMFEDDGDNAAYERLFSGN